jgi:hypothetical protein
MRPFDRQLAILITAVTLALTAMSFSTIPVAANPGITVSGALLIADISPGETLTHKITITIGAKDPPTDVVVQIGGIGQATDGTYIMLDSVADTSGYSARRFISIDQDLLHLEPGTAKDVIATVRIPEDIGDGGSYAIINISTQPANSKGVSVISAVNIPVYLTIKNTKGVHEGKITDVSISEILPGAPIDIFTDFQNTGNHHFKVKGEVDITDSSSTVLDTIYTALTPTSILPNITRQCKVSFIPSRELSPGVYSVKSKVILEDGIVLDESNTSFEVTAPYMPPPPPATRTVFPAEGSVLETSGSRISISFPKGAVTEKANVTLRDYPLSQLPPLPPEYQPATICFRVDGITGLLAQNATVAVRYTGADIEKAAGNAGRLKLAYWDEATSQWSVLKTTVDKTTMTLSTTTNHFSIWTVMVSPPPEAKLPLVIGAIVAGVIIVSGSVTLFVNKKRR